MYPHKTFIHAQQNDIKNEIPKHYNITISGVSTCVIRVIPRHIF